MTDMDSPETPAGTAPDAAPTEGVPEGGVKVKKAPRARRTRGITAWVLVVLASLLIPVSVISVWAIRTVTNTDQYVATMAPLARNQVIVEHLAQKATDELFSTGIVKKKVEAALPKAAKPIVTPVVSEVKTYVYGLALKVFESPKFGQLWDYLNRHTHDAVVDVLTGKQSKLVQRVEKGGGIVVNVTPQINDLISQASAHGITLFNPLKAVLAKGDSLGVTVVSKSQVSQFSALFNLIVTLKWALPVIALVLAAIGIIIAVDHRKTLLRMAIGVALVTMLLLAGLSLGRITFINQAGHSFNRDVAASVWDTVLRFLKTDLRWMLLFAVLVALGSWLAGPARYARWIRSTCAKGGRWVAAQARGLSSDAGRAAAGSERTRRTGGWILEHLNGLRILGVVVAALFLVFGGNLTGWSLLIIVIVLAVYLGLLQVVAAWARKVSASVTASGASRA
jgi:hypothetical protein